MQMMRKPIDFKKVEALRKHMLLTIKDMSYLLNVTRMTYYSWIKGGPLRKSNDKKVRAMLKQLLNVMTVHEWPTPNIIALEPKERQAKLLELITNNTEES